MGTLASQDSTTNSPGRWSTRGNVNHRVGIVEMVRSVPVGHRADRNSSTLRHTRSATEATGAEMGRWSRWNVDRGRRAAPPKGVGRKSLLCAKFTCPVLPGIFLCSIFLLSALVPARAAQPTLIADAHINSALPTTNSGAIANLIVGGGYTTLLQFDLSLLPSGTTASQVSRAVLRLYCNRVTTAGLVTYSPINAAWGEYSVTYATEPAIGSAAGIVSVTQAGAFVTIDVTSLVQGWIATPASNYGLALSAGAAQVQFDSKENDQTAHSATPGGCDRSCWRQWLHRSHWPSRSNWAFRPGRQRGHCRLARSSRSNRSSWTNGNYRLARSSRGDWSNWRHRFSRPDRTRWSGRCAGPHRSARPAGFARPDGSARPSRSRRPNFSWHLRLLYQLRVGRWRSV